MLSILSSPATATVLAVAAGDGPNAERLARLIVYILVVIALVLTVLTVWYWNRTRPEKRAPAQVARSAAPNQVVVPAPQTPVYGAPAQQIPASGPQWVDPQPGAGGPHNGPQWQADAPAAGPQWTTPVPESHGHPQQPRPAQGPDWGSPPAQR